MLFPKSVLVIAFSLPYMALSQKPSLTLLDRFAIYEQMHLHQTFIDTDQTCANSRAYANLYWPEGSFRVIDPNRDNTVNG